MRISKKSNVQMATPKATAPTFQQKVAVKLGLNKYAGWSTINAVIHQRTEAKKRAELSAIVDRVLYGGQTAAAATDPTILTREEAQEVVAFGAHSKHTKARVAATEKKFGADLRDILRGGRL